LVSTFAFLEYFESTPVILFWAASTIYCFVHVFLSVKYRDEGGFRSWELAQASSHEALRLSQLSLLILRAVDDEAALSLALGALGNRVTNFFIHIMERYLGLTLKAIGFVGIAWLTVYLVVAWVSLLFGPKYLYWSVDWLNSARQWLSSFLPFLNGTAFAAISLIAFSGLSKSMYGRELLFGPLTCTINSQSVPDIVTSRVRCVTLNQGRRPLRHMIYDDENCIYKIADWLEEQLGTSNTMIQ
jgi:hypothetical protein